MINRICILAFTAAAICILTASCVNEKTSDGDYDILKVGDRVPSGLIVSGSGGSFSFDSGFDGKTTLLVFFRTGCGDCRRELPKAFAVWHDMVADPSVQVITISREETAAKVTDYWEERGFVNMPWFLDPDRKVYSRFARSKIPRFYIVGPDGVIKWMMTEYLLTDGREMTADELIDIFKSYAQ